MKRFTQQSTTKLLKYFSKSWKGVLQVSLSWNKKSFHFRSNQSITPSCKLLDRINSVQKIELCSNYKYM